MCEFVDIFGLIRIEVVFIADFLECLNSDWVELSLRHVAEFYFGAKLLKKAMAGSINYEKSNRENGVMFRVLTAVFYGRVAMGRLLGTVVVGFVLDDGDDFGWDGSNGSQFG